MEEEEEQLISRLVWPISEAMRGGSVMAHRQTHLEGGNGRLIAGDGEIRDIHAPSTSPRRSDPPFRRSASPT